MRSTVNRRFIQDDQVLIDTTATHIKSGGSFGARTYTRQKLNRFQNILLAQNYRDHPCLFGR